MKETKKTYWKGIEQLTNDPAYVKHADKEFGYLGIDEDTPPSRRDFLKLMGFGVAAVSLAACEAPIRKAIPYVNKPVDVDPSIPNYYASTYINGGDYCSIVVKTREGRPIKIDGNTLSSVTGGGTSAQVEASVLSLYDNSRLRFPKINGANATWEEVDAEVKSKLAQLSVRGSQIAIISNTILSPSTLSVIEEFKAKYPSAKHISYDQVSSYGIMQANEASFGASMIPSYNFAKAKTIVSIGADFLGTWLSPIEFTTQFSKTRKLGDSKKDMSRLYAFESNMSLTGANADYRTPVKASQQGLVVAQLYNLIAAKAGVSTVNASIKDVKYLDKAANDLWTNRAKSLVVCGSNDKNVQIMVNAINSLLGNYGTTIDTANAINFRKGDDKAMASFVSDLEAGRIGGVIFYNSNPVYDHPMGDKIAAAIAKAELKVSTSYKEDETASLTDIIAPDHHYLESWNDAEPKKNHFSLAQPTITPIFRTRQAQSSFLTWAESDETDYFNVIKKNWKNWFYSKSDKSDNFQTFWDKALYDGVMEFPESTSAIAFEGDVNAAATFVAKNYKENNAGFELVIFESAGLGNGSQANNPLLHELPEPITKATWDNYLTISQKDATALGLSMVEGKTRKANLIVNGKELSVPVLIQPGQANGTLGLALGYGRTKAGRVADNVGVNAYPLLYMLDGNVNYHITSGVELSITDEVYSIAQTQTHQTYMGRQTVIQESVLDEYKNNPSAGRFNAYVATWTDKNHKVAPAALSLWKGHEYKNHYWGMAIDLNSCTGCSACLVACNVENNVPVVGKQEVLNRREMHWLRIDRYYSSDADVNDWKGLEKASENPEVVFQPMMCQHCNNAPCETVCPVAATTHSTEGLNQMTYNRCIGTRYCANNCPYKVRRFNWFKYHHNEQFATSNPQMNTDLGRMVLNPDVTVRSRGVMEKCSFCVQRIQNGKLSAKKERRPMKDGEVVTACQAACAAGAIVFGDMNDPESKISKLLDIEQKEGDYGIDKTVRNPRAYRVLEEIGVKPNVFYLTKIRNKEIENA
jgi:MoCo/4Fe-4S cofactor protein with predicted Tat translocation signal